MGTHEFNTNQPASAHLPELLINIGFDIDFDYDGDGFFFIIIIIIITVNYFINYLLYLLFCGDCLVVFDSSFV